MKIKGWEKLNGITYKGYSILNPIFNSFGTKYYCDILDIANRHKMFLTLDTEAGIDNHSFMLKLEDKKNRIIVNRILNLEMLKSISNFRMVFEMCIEDYIKEMESQWSPFDSGTPQPMPKSSSILPTFDDFVKMWRTTPAGQLTQTLIEK